ncbi:CDP-6-deoxy-D-xylo-4-hexulose-3-dehydrase [Halanaerobium saccharolyticum]|uniref:CDP-6-deoxy-D-xylo-4-hexulose-3-dehydrase n=1 Tax=Halanaerobium saccharolyticum TaxID=43595 RepID=A0A4V3CV89_9FIRM|nr:DegT/DnrJ/EryC1/StrS family aminotransferase [Halanaerobium saccharolyticum]TDP81568.1 CDP-6-deoxy-D-xylo-4-hexulose-3-dehydrase [Halanaerobium saccharolyticum]
MDTIDLPLATDSWDEEELKAIEKVVDSHYFTMGKEVEKYEREFADFFGAEFAVMVNSGSSANLLSVASLIFCDKYDLNPGDEVIVPAVSWATTFYPLQQYDLKIKFVDINKHTLNIDIKEIENAISAKTKAVFAVNLLGNSINYKRLLKIADDNNLIIIEDNCESMGAKFNNKYTGTFGVLGTFSTFFSHHISTMEGGMILTDDEDLKNILVSLRAHGWTRDLPESNNLYKKGSNSFYESFNFILPGYNVRPLEIEGAIGTKQLKKLPSIVNGRRENGTYFLELFSDLDSVYIQKEIGESSFFGFPIIVKENANFNRDDLVSELQKNNVDCRPIVAGNFTKNEVIKYFKYTIFGDLKNADFIHNNGLFIGNHHFDIKSKLNSIYKIIRVLESK